LFYGSVIYHIRERGYGFSFDNHSDPPLEHWNAVGAIAIRLIFATIPFKAMADVPENRAAMAVAENEVIQQAINNRENEVIQQAINNREIPFLVPEADVPPRVVTLENSQGSMGAKVAKQTCPHCGEEIQ